MRAQIADLDQQIRSEGEAAGAFARERGQGRGAAARDALAPRSISSRGRRPRPATRTSQLRALEREAKAQRELFESYLAKYREATARDSIAAAPADARIISRATVSNIPYFPKKTPIVVIAALGTFSPRGGFRRHRRADQRRDEPFGACIFARGAGRASCCRLRPPPWCRLRRSVRSKTAFARPKNRLPRPMSRRQRPNLSLSPRPSSSPTRPFDRCTCGRDRKPPATRRAALR